MVRSAFVRFRHMEHVHASDLLGPAPRSFRPSISLTCRCRGGFQTRPCRNRSVGRWRRTTRLCQNPIRERQRPPKLVLPAKAGIQAGCGGERRCSAPPPPLDSRFRGNDGGGPNAALAFATREWRFEHGLLARRVMAVEVPPRYELLPVRVDGAADDSLSVIPDQRPEDAGDGSRRGSRDVGIAGEPAAPVVL